MIEIAYYVAMSLDGFIAPPDGSLDWLHRFLVEGEDFGYAAFYRTTDVVLVGRRTYDQSLTFPTWPYPDKPCWVFSKAPVAPRGGVVHTTLGPRAAAAELELRGHRRAWLIGGGKLAAAFRADGLITEYIVTVLPVMLGTGIPLFDGPGPHQDLTLVDTKTYPLGLVQLRYVPAR